MSQDRDQTREWMRSHGIENNARSIAGMDDEESRLAALDWLMERDGLTEKQAERALEEMNTIADISKAQLRAIIDKYRKGV